MKLFTYGSLMASDIMEEVTGGRFASYKATAGGFQRFCVRDELYPGMVADETGEVEGVVYVDVDPLAMQQLDIFEGEMYARQQIDVQRQADNSVLQVMAYIVKPEFRHLLTGTVWSYETFLEKGKRLFCEQYAGFREIKES